jgi:hypothetical protein
VEVLATSIKRVSDRPNWPLKSCSLGTGKRFSPFALPSTGAPLNQKTLLEQGFLEMELGGLEPPTS